jgi:hypothetical protein
LFGFLRIKTFLPFTVLLYKQTSTAMKKKIYGFVLLAAILGMLTTGCEAMKGAAPPPPPGAPAHP